MFWRQIHLAAPESLKDALVGVLSEYGLAGAVESLTSPGELDLYFEEGANGEAIRTAIESVYVRSGVALPEVDETIVPSENWTEEWKRSFRAFPIGSKFFVIPSWDPSPCPFDREPLYIDPGMAFGTGTHETTQMTVEATERWLERTDAVMDVGTGSGILAIVASKLGAASVTACDLDPIAVEAAAANFKRNGCESIGLFQGSANALPTDTHADLLLANLTTDQLIRALPEFDRVLRHDGRAVFSGILLSQREPLEKQIEEMGYMIYQQSARREWLTLVVARKFRPKA